MRHKKVRNFEYLENGAEGRAGVGKSVRFGQEEFSKLGQDAMLAGAGGDDKFIKGSALAGCEASMRTRIEVSANSACEKRSRSTCGKVQCHPNRHKVSRH